MLNLLADTFVFGNKNFGLSIDAHNPYLSIFGFEIYLYAIVIVTGMCLAILVGGLYFKKRGYDPYDITIYALVIIPVGVLGARAYVYIFPWQGREMDWSTFFTGFRDGGLGIYGGVIMGYIAAAVVAKIKKHDFRIVVDSIMPGLFLAQSLGRWGNFFNQEAHGEFITADYSALPNFTEWIFGPNHHGFNGYAVWIDSAHAGAQGAGWYQATFFYENFCTLLGFVLCVAVLTRSKHYKLGWCSAFYGIFYGIVRLVIEGFRTDSLYLYVGKVETDIKISQLVSVFAIIFGVVTLTKIYRKEMHALYKKLFKSEYDEIAKSRWVLLGVSIVLLAVGVTMLSLSGVTKAQNGKGGESYLIAGVVLTALAIYSGLGVWSLFDRLKIYDATTGERAVEPEHWQTEREQLFTATVCYGVIIGALFAFGLFALIKWGIVDKISNGTVLFVASLGCIVAIALTKFMPTLKRLLALNKPSDETPSGVQTSVQNDDGKGAAQSVDGTAEAQNKAHGAVKLNKFLLFVFPPKVYLDYGISHLTPYVDTEAEAKKAARKAKRSEKK